VINAMLPEPVLGPSVRVSDEQPAWPEVAQFCPRCGAPVCTRCQDCSAPIKGVSQNRIGWMNYEPPAFCEMCASPYPWLNREGRIYLLQNMLDEQDMDPATRLEVREQLEALASPDLSDEEQAALWQQVKRRAPTLWDKTGAQKILETVVSAAIKGQLGLP
jgi:hypothetical protein